MWLFRLLILKSVWGKKTAQKRKEEAKKPTVCTAHLSSFLFCFGKLLCILVLLQRLVWSVWKGTSLERERREENPGKGAKISSLHRFFEISFVLRISFTYEKTKFGRRRCCSGWDIPPSIVGWDNSAILLSSLFCAESLSRNYSSLLLLFTFYFFLSSRACVRRLTPRPSPRLSRTANRTEGEEEAD